MFLLKAGMFRSDFKNIFSEFNVYFSAPNTGKVDFLLEKL